MKKMKLIKTLLFTLLLFTFVGYSCSDNNEVSLEGSLNVSFYNMTSDLSILLYDIKNDQVPIYDIPIGHGDLKLALNAGSYIIKPYSSSVFYSKKGLMIRPGKTTTIVYKENNEAIVN